MISEYHGLDRFNQKLHIFVEYDERALKVEGRDLMMQRVVADALQFVKKGQRGELRIRVVGVDDATDRVRYEILGEQGNPVHAIAFQHFEKKRAADLIVERSVYALPSLGREVGVTSLLERYRAERPIGVLGKLWIMITDFLDKILEKFTILEKLYRALGGVPKKRLKKDIALLTQVCEAPVSEGISMRESLDYISKMMEREHHAVTDPNLKKRLREAASLAKTIERERTGLTSWVVAKIPRIIKKPFSGLPMGPDRAIEQSVKRLQKSIKELDQGKVLIPVGYVGQEGLEESLLEVSKDEKGTYTVAWISASENTRYLFDRENGLKGTSQSLRREITGVSAGDLLAAIPTFLELQMRRECLDTKQGDAWQSLFLQTLRFEGSQVSVSPATKTYRKGTSPGHVVELLSYLKTQYQTPEEAQRFELATRLRFFLDVFQRTKGRLTDKDHWKVMRATALQLAKAIEDDKGILGNRSAQSLELTRIYYKLQEVLHHLDKHLPIMPKLEKQSPPAAKGRVHVESAPWTPHLRPAGFDTNVYPQVDPPLTGLDKNKPAESIKTWGLRCRELIRVDQSALAAQEVKILICMLPPPSDDMWNQMSPAELPEVLKALSTMGEAIVRDAKLKEPSSLHDIASLAYLTLLTHELIKDTKPHDAELFGLMAANTVTALYNDSRLPIKEKDWLRNIEESTKWEIPAGDIGDMMAKVNADSLLQPLINLSEFTAIVAGIEGVSSANLDSTGEITVNVSKSLLCSKVKQDLRLWLRVPTYAETVSQEVTNRYLSEFCCLGCIRDNCPNYNQVPLRDHRFHPLYMLHNNVDTFCTGLLTRGVLPRDEAADLMYTQQTNQNAHEVWVNVHKHAHGFSVAHAFDTSDRIMQALNTFSLYLDKPHFFKHADLRWHFDTKILTKQIVPKMLLNKRYRPFLTSMLKKLSREIAVSHIGGHFDTCVYLMGVAETMTEWIKKSTIDQEDKDALSKLIDINIDDVTNKIAYALIPKTDDKAWEQCQVVFPMILNRYYRKVTENPDDPWINDERHLEIIMAIVGKLENIPKAHQKIDPELKDRYLSLIAWVLPKIKAKLVNERSPSAFVNRILLHVNPLIARLGLDWQIEEFPIAIGSDNRGGTYQFDLRIGQVLVKSSGKRMDTLPEHIKGNRNVQKIFGSVLDDTWNIFQAEGTQKKIRGFLHPKFPNYRIITIKGAVATQITIERLIVNEKGKKEWVSYVRFGEQDRVVDRLSPNAMPDIPPQMAIAIGDRDCWVNRSKKNIYVFETGSTTPYAVLKVGTIREIQDDLSIVKKPFIEEMRLVKENKVLLAPSEKFMRRFTSIEDPKYILVTGAAKKKRSKPSTVDYSRYELATNGAPLRYKLTPQGPVSEAFPGFALAPYGERPGSKDPAYGVIPIPELFDGFQLLKKDGAEKVLIPLRQYEHQLTTSNETLPLSKPVYPEGYDKCQLYEFTVDPETNRLVARSGDAYAYLAYVCCMHNDFDSARFYLTKAHSSSGYNANYDQIFRWADEWTDSSPNAVAMKLRFAMFQEKITQDRVIFNIKEGRLSQAEKLKINRVKRLTDIADLYKTYTKNVESRAVGGDGGDPVLDLEPEEQQYVRESIRELLKQHGPQLVNADAPPQRAEEIAVQQFLQTDAKDEFGMAHGTLLIWAYSGSRRQRSSLTVKDPMWMLTNFRDLFNRILKEDVESHAFKQIEHQLRMMSEVPRHLYFSEHQAVERAQSNLLKLIHAKKFDPGLVTQLQSMLGKNELLPRIQGPLLTNSRMKCILNFKNADLNLYFDDFALGDAGHAITQATKLARSKNRKLASLGKKARAFILRWKKKPTIANFPEAFRQFIYSNYYGTGGARSLTLLDEIFSILEPVRIEQKIQKYERPPKQKIKPPETYQSRYGKLVEASRPQVDASFIQRLEQEIAGRAEPPLQRIETTPDKVHAVLGDGFVASCKRYFSERSLAKPEISEDLFTDLENSEERAYARLARVHKNEMRQAHKERPAVTLERASAEDLQKDLKREMSAVEQDEEKLRKDLLQYVERFQSAAGTLAMRRLTGKSVKPSIDLLVLLWRRGDITKPWEENPFRELDTHFGPSKYSHKNLAKLDNDLTRYVEIMTKKAQLSRAIGANQTYLDSCPSGASAIGDGALALDVAHAVSVKRHFATDGTDSDYRDFLFMEYSPPPIILRESQVKLQRDMISNPNAVRQLGMGEGKSKVVTPLLAKRKANGKNLVMLMLPEELYETNCRDLDDINRRLFNQKMHRFEFSRQSDRSVEALQIMYQRMLETIHSKGYMMTTKRSILSLKNSYIDLLYKLQQPIEVGQEAEREMLLAQVRAMNKILKLLKDHTDILADEVDACLDVRKEVNFAIGKASPIDKIKIDTGAELMQMVLSTRPSTPLQQMSALWTQTYASKPAMETSDLFTEVTRTFYDEHSDDIEGSRELYDVATELLGYAVHADEKSPIKELSTVLAEGRYDTLPKERQQELLAQLAGMYYDHHVESLGELNKDAFIAHMLDHPIDATVATWIKEKQESDPSLCKQLQAVRTCLQEGFSKIDPLYPLSLALQKNAQAALSPERRNELLSHLSRAYYDKHQAVFENIDKEAFVAYVMNATTDRTVEEWVFGLYHTNNDLYKQLTTFKGFINRGFGTTLGRVGKVNYGLDPISGVEVIPYKASNTPHVGSKFDDEIEQLAFTYQEYLQSGVSYKQVYRIIAYLHNKALDELRGMDQEQLVNILDTPAAAEFDRFIREIDPKGILGRSLTLATVSTPTAIAALVTAINKTPEARISYCQRQVTNKIRQYDAQINSVSTDLPEIVRSFGGFTGTPWNMHTYHDKISPERNPGVDGLTWSLTLTKGIGIHEFAFNPDKPVDSLLASTNVVGNYQAVIDTGAYLRGISNREFIEQAIEVSAKQNKGVAAGIYFNDAGVIVKQPTEGATLPLEVAAVTDLISNLTLYDQAHTVGADIRQAKKAKAIVTIGENTFIRDLFQAIWRLRQYHQEQTVALIVSEQLKERILAGEDRPLTIDDILKFCLKNEARREAEDNFRAEKERINGAAKRAALSNMIDLIEGGADDQAIITMAGKVASPEAGLFLKPRSKEKAYDEYAILKVPEKPLKVLQGLRKAGREKALKLAKDFDAVSTQVGDRVRQLAANIDARPDPSEDLFPNAIDSTASDGAEVEQEAQAEIEEAIEIAVQTEVETEVAQEILIPIAPSGKGDHGDVVPLSVQQITQLITTNTYDTNGLRPVQGNLPFFDKSIYSSAVFERNLLRERPQQPLAPQTTFYSNRKPVKTALIVKSQDKWRMIIPTIHEAHAACRDFIEDDTPKQAVEVTVSPSKPLILYKSGEDRTDELPFTDEEDRKQFYRLYIQAKLFNGEIDFHSSDEKEALKTWLQEKGAKAFKTYFEENILAAKPRRFADNYPKSSLISIFQELGVA